MSLILHLHQWSQLKYALLNWFTDPRRVLLPLLLIGLMALCLKVSPYKKPILLRSICSLGATYLLLISPLGATVATRGLTLFLLPDIGQSADAIVVLGRGPLAEQERAQAAANLWKAHRAPTILTTGRGEAPRLSTQLIQLGIPLNVQLIEPEARTTEENAIHSFELLQSIGASRIILVTDQPHMLRSVLTFRSFGFETIPYPVQVPSSLPAIEKTALALREYVGLVSYALIGRFQPRAMSVVRLNESSKEIVMQTGRLSG
ncbi:YdcF family protein [Leptothoe spongobia]|uniref:YdcF family protein n=1 Tax=Leptothoe spongobia TAU-MAC 1115 TaxID=1967444 RepID=A0A947GLV4_9CYAN|nr:YdcF family protein [Leptothoe spongobia]MBT9317262.1 YdcF family protein [Leptothoe spongobia TAU-MAC 1115]